MREENREEKKEEGLVDLLAELVQRMKALEEEISRLRSLSYQMLRSSDIENIAENVEQVLARKMHARLR